MTNSRRKDPMALDIGYWETPASNYPLSSLGSARIKRAPQTRGYYAFWGMDGYIYYRVLRRIQITRLEIQNETAAWQTWMVDDPPQWRAMEKYAEAATGNVLTTGLGLGLVCHLLAKNPRVTSITVVECNIDVISLVSPLVPHVPPLCSVTSMISSRSLHPGTPS